MLDALIERMFFDYSKSDIAKETGIPRVTMNKFWPQLIKQGLIKETRRIGRASLYSLNKKSPIVKKLLELDFAITKQYNDALLEKETMKVRA